MYAAPIPEPQGGWLHGVGVGLHGERERVKVAKEPTAVQASHDSSWLVLYECNPIHLIVPVVADLARRWR